MKNTNTLLPATIVCTSCSNTFETRSTIGSFKVEICNLCHPFTSGVSVEPKGSQIEKFRRRYARV